MFIVDNDDDDDDELFNIPTNYDNSFIRIFLSRRPAREITFITLM